MTRFDWIARHVELIRRGLVQTRAKKGKWQQQGKSKGRKGKP